MFMVWGVVHMTGLRKRCRFEGFFLPWKKINSSEWIIIERSLLEGWLRAQLNVIVINCAQLRSCP